MNEVTSPILDEAIKSTEEAIRFYTQQADKLMSHLNENTNDLLRENTEWVAFNILKNIREGKYLLIDLEQKRPINFMWLN